MTEQIGTSLIGSTTYSNILVNTQNAEIVPVVLPGGAALSLTKGMCLQDDAAAGQKKGYTNADTTPTGLCILLDDVTTTVAGGNVTANALVAGSVKQSAVTDDAGAAIDAAFRDHEEMKNVRWS